MDNPLLTITILPFVLMVVIVATSLKDSLCEKVTSILLTANLAAVFVLWAFRDQFWDFAVSLLDIHEPILATFLTVLSATHLKRFKNKRFIVTLMILNCAIGLFSAFVLYWLLGQSA